MTPAARIFAFGLLIGSGAGVACGGATATEPAPARPAPAPTVTPIAAPAASRAPSLTRAQRRRADALVSLFENGTTTVQYCYIEALSDGRGYTAGRAGFTSATADLLQVAELYTQRVPDNPLVPLLPRLRELGRDNDGSTEGLESLPSAWAQTCDDPRQRATQDSVLDELYYQPAVRRWRTAGLVRPLSLAAIYDALVQHGEGDDPDGMPALMRRAASRAGGTPAGGKVSESAFLRAFLAVRRATLEHAHNPETREVWAESVGRVDVFSQLLRTRQYRLAAPVKVRTPQYRSDIK